MELTNQQLVDAIGCATGRALLFTQPLNDAMAKFGITTSKRVCAFLAQIAHESGKLVYVREIWGPTKAQEGYEGRADLGNVYPGDGKKYLGRGLIQITGRANYKICGDALGVDFESEPVLLESSRYAALSAAWYWAKHGCNELADAGEFITITRRINGGLNGQEQRVALLEQATSIIV